MSKVPAAATVGTLELGHDVFAAGSDEVKIALVGCGGRGTGAAFDALGNRTHSNIRLVAMADAFAGPLERAHQDLQNQFHDKVDVPPARRFVGLDAYEKAIAAGAGHRSALHPARFPPRAVRGGGEGGQEHMFLEKPVAVDAPGYRTVKSANAEATRKGLFVAVGHHLRHAKSHIEAVRQIHDGLIGDLLFTRAYFNTQGIWNRPRQPGMTEMQYQVNNWYHFVWLSGDHIVEQHVHGIDACNWIARARRYRPRAWAAGRFGQSPASARSSITTAFSTPIPMARTASASAGSSPAAGRTSAIMPTARRVLSASTAATAVVIQLKGSQPKRLKPGRDGHQTEWDDLLAAVIANRPYNELEWAADSTLTAILGRMATYSGKLVTWDEAVKSDLTYAPERIAWDALPRSKAGPDGIYPCAMPGITKAV